MNNIEMRVLTVRQPWAWAIIHGGKDVENRVRNIAGDYRGPIAVHAGVARFEDDGQYREVKRAIVSEQNGWPADDAELWGADLVEPDDPRFVYGAIIGVVDLTDVHYASECVYVGTAIEDFDGNFVSQEVSYCSPWAEDANVYHLVLANPRALDEPIPYKGALGLRRLDAATIARVLGAAA